MLEIPDIFLGVNGRCWALAYVCRKNESTPLSPPPFWGATRAQKVSPGHDGDGGEMEEWCPGSECFADFDLLVFYRGERFIPICLKSYTVSKAGHHWPAYQRNVILLGGGGGGLQ